MLCCRLTVLCSVVFDGVVFCLTVLCFVWRSCVLFDGLVFCLTVLCCVCRLYNERLALQEASESAAGSPSHATGAQPPPSPSCWAQAAATCLDALLIRPALFAHLAKRGIQVLGPCCYIYSCSNPSHRTLSWEISNLLTASSSEKAYYASPSPGEAFRDRWQTTNFELWVEIFCVPTCFHVRIPKPCPSVCPYPEKRNHHSFVNISPTLVIDTSMERSSLVLKHGNPKIWISWLWLLIRYQKRWKIRPWDGTFRGYI